MLANIGLYAKAVVAFLAEAGVVAQAALSDGIIEASEWSLIVVGLLGAVGVLAVPNAKSSEGSK